MYTHNEKKMENDKKSNHNNYQYSHWLDIFSVANHLNKFLAVLILNWRQATVTNISLEFSISKYNCVCVDKSVTLNSCVYFHINLSIIQQFSLSSLLPFHDKGKKSSIKYSRSLRSVANSASQRIFISLVPCSYKRYGRYCYDIFYCSFKIHLLG